MKFTILVPLVAAALVAAPTVPARAGDMPLPAIPVTGLTTDTTAKVETALKDLTSSYWECESCMELSGESGTCCGTAKATKSGKVFCAAKADATASTINVTLVAGREVKLSDIERALSAQSVKVQRDKLTLGAETCLVIGNVADQKAADELAKALTEAKVFEKIEAKVPAGRREASLYVKKAGSSAPTEAKVREALVKANPTATIADIAWVAPAKA